MLLEPIDAEIKGKKFVLSKFPAVAGRKIVFGYPLTGMPKIGDYQANEEMMLLLMSFVGVKLPNGEVMALTTRDLVDNHVGDWEVLFSLEKQMLTYNCSFFHDGRLSTFLNGLTESLPDLITKILTGSLERFFPQDKQNSTN